MREALSIWSPVVLSELINPKSADFHQVYHLDDSYQGMEGLRIKLREHIIRKQGNALETLFKMEVLCLLENMEGKMQLLKKEENLRERVLLQEFDRELDFDREPQIDFIGDIKKIDWRGGLDGKQLHVVILIDYALLAIRQQVIKLWEQEMGEDIAMDKCDITAEIQPRDEIIQMEKENLELSRQIRFYEKNIAHLKKGIKKAESRNIELNRESQQHLTLIEDLRRAIKDKEQRLDDYESGFRYRDNHLCEESCSSDKEYEKMANNSLGSRVKRLFLNSI